MKRNRIADILNDNIKERIVPCWGREGFKPTILVYMQFGDICIEFNTADTCVNGFHYYKSFQSALIFHRDEQLYVRNLRGYCKPHHPLSGMTPIDRTGAAKVIANSLCVNYRTVKRWFRRAQHYSGMHPIMLHVIK